MVIDIEGNKCELLPITKPKGNYMILEAACEHFFDLVSSKSLT